MLLKERKKPDKSAKQMENPNLSLISKNQISLIQPIAFKSTLKLEVAVNYNWVMVSTFYVRNDACYTDMFQIRSLK